MRVTFVRKERNMIKIIIGIAIIVLSLAYITKNHDKSLMDTLMEKRKKAMEQAEQNVQEPPAEDQ